MKCGDFELHWEDWREGKAPAEFEEHLRECAPCRELAAELLHELDQDQEPDEDAEADADAEGEPREEPRREEPVPDEKRDEERPVHEEGRVRRTLEGADEEHGEEEEHPTREHGET